MVKQTRTDQISLGINIKMNNQLRDGGYTKSMLDDCTLEFLRVEHHLSHSSTANYLKDHDDFTDEDEQEIIDKNFYKALQKQKAFEYNNLDESHFQKWENMKYLRDERFNREDKINVLRQHKAVWPIYKYTQEK